MPTGVSLPKLQASLDKLETQVAEVTAEMRRIGEQIRNTKGESNSRFESTLQDQQAKHSAIRADIGSMRGDVNNMRTDVAARMSSLEKRLAGLEESMRSLEKSLK
jgi:chromosome segregation ATPase